MATSIDTSSAYQNIGLSQFDANKETAKKKELGQEDFLSLLTSQLANQDPLKPMDNTDFIAQMAQFSSLEGMNQLNKSFGNLSTSLVSNQALQASALVGRTVQVNSDVANLSLDSNVQASVALDNVSTNLQFQIFDSKGSVIRTVNQGPQAIGEHSLSWDGRDDNGKLMSPGNYSIKAVATIDGKAQTIPTQVVAHVDSVSMGAAGSGVFNLNLTGLGQVAFSDVQSIQ